ncbi:hypothetical protein K8T06_14990, partial [bacterium]|nr:hypothetical protein [bacterium]
YRNIAMAFCEAFECMGLNADMASRETRSISGSITSCFASPSAFEILVEGRKLLGSAQKRTRNRVLQHGSLLIDYREEDWNLLMRRKTRLDIGRVVDLRFLLGPDFSISMVKTMLIQAFESYFGVKTIPLQLTEEELSKAMEIAQNKYSNLMG